MAAESRTAVTRNWKMLRDARTAGLVKLRRGIGMVGGSRLWAGHVLKGDHGSQLCSGRYLRIAA